jgi:hypothetical protein
MGGKRVVARNAVDARRTHFIRVKKKGTGAMSGLRKLPMPPSTNDDPAGSASPRFALHGVIGIHLINEHRHYRAPIQEYNLQGSAA